MTNRIAYQTPNMLCVFTISIWWKFYFHEVWVGRGPTHSSPVNIIHLKKELWSCVNKMNHSKVRLNHSNEGSPPHLIPGYRKLPFHEQIFLSTLAIITSYDSVLEPYRKIGSLVRSTSPLKKIWETGGGAVPHRPICPIFKVNAFWGRRWYPPQNVMWNIYGTDPG